MQTSVHDVSPLVHRNSRAPDALNGGGPLNSEAPLPRESWSDAGPRAARLTGIQPPVCPPGVDSDAAHVHHARAVLTSEAQAILSVRERLGTDFVRLVDLILETTGRVIVCGMGKSGLIGRKISATLASTGTPSFFMHPGDAYHGDLGMVTPEDAFLALSNSGETEEVVRLLPFLRDNGNVLLSLTGAPDSTLARNSDVHVNIHVASEACPIRLAPTNSTTVALAVGDAIAVALMKARNFQPETFARFHPGGNLGRMLLSSAGQYCSTEVPSVTDSARVHEILLAISAGKLGLCFVHSDGATLGIITDGDVRRAIQADPASLEQMTASALVNRTPHSIPADMRLWDAERTMKSLGVNVVVVRDSAGAALGALSIKDL